MGKIWKTSIDNLVRYSQLQSDYQYSSTQFNIPKELSEKIIRWAVENISEDQIVHDSKDPGTKGIQLESHITLKYGLKTNDFEEIEKVLRSEKAPHVKFGQTTFFEPKGKDYDVVVIKVESEDLQNLNKKLCSQVEHEDTQGKEYHPHVTVAYVKKGIGKNWEGKDIITGEEIYLDKLTFSPKEGEKRELELVKATEKESSFMPSNTDLAPSDDWAGTVGFPTNEAMDNVWPRDDGENYYSPMDDRPRDKSVWWKLLNMFKKQQPLGKKDVIPVKEAEVKKEAGVLEVPILNGKDFVRVFQDPTHEQLSNLLDKFPEGLRWVRDPASKSLFVWDANKSPHLNIILGLGLPRKIYDSGSHDWGYIEGDGDIREVLQYKQIPVTSKQWTTPKEPVNQPGMDWQWADYIYNYVDKNWQDFLVGWLELNPKNYIKPVILIEKIYQDEGRVSAWVHIEFVNMAGNPDAFMKLVISGDVHYESSYEPEGVETIEYLDNWETEVLDYGKSDELEKSGGYGPTNYKGPSVADELYQDSPYRMNVTYSPEEDEELMDQNGKGGYPNRWMSRHRGPYYTNEGKVIKMLEETSAALSKKDIEKNAITGPQLGWLAPDGKYYSVMNTSHGAWIDKNYELLKNKYGIDVLHEGSQEFEDDIISWLISKGWVRVDGYLPHDLDFILADVHNTPLSVEKFIFDHNPEVVILEDLNRKDLSIPREDFGLGLDKAIKKNSSLKMKADISGQVVNNILKLIQQNGGATYNLSKGNLVGTDAYAVAIYPDREQIVSGIDYDTLEGYLIQNEDLLSNPNNSFGAWISGGNKLYLDIVATVKDLNEAVELGRKHNQLAIFNLKTLQEIPIQKLAKLAATYSDREMQRNYDSVYSERWPEDSAPIDGGNIYYDFAEGGSNDYPNPKDEEKEHVYMDLLDDPAKANFPAGLPEYTVVFYDSNPDVGDQGGI